MEIKINKDVTLRLPNGFRKVYVKRRDLDVKKWARALRSGAYKQGRFKLEHCGAFCCLGVLAKSKKEQTKYYNHLYAFHSAYNTIGSHGKLPEECFLITIKENPVVDLARANDVLEMSFSEIAKVIELCWTNNKEDSRMRGK